MTLLIADDNARVRMMLRDLLNRHLGSSPTIIECSDGNEAVEAVGVHRPDWILLDIRMPKLDGFSAAKAILRIVPGSKIIIVTSYDEPELRREAEKCGAVSFVAKDNLFALLDILPTGE